MDWRKYSVSESEGILKVRVCFHLSREWPCGTEPVKYEPEPVEIPPDRGFTILGRFSLRISVIISLSLIL